MRYAAQTSVSSEKSRCEIERILHRYGATGFVYGWQNSSAAICFQMHNKTIKFVLPLPNKNDSAFSKTPGGRRSRSVQSSHLAWEQACRQKWRALALSIKAKLETVESGIETFEREFLSHFVLASGETFGDYAVPRINAALQERRMPLLLENV